MKKCKKITNYFSEFLKKEKENVSEATLKCRERHLNQFEKWLIANDFKNITPDDFNEKILEQYKEFLSKKQGKRGKRVSETTQKAYLRTIRYFFCFLEENASANPSARGAYGRPPPSRSCRHHGF